MFITGTALITGFNFDIDLAVRSHKAIAEKDRFFIGILRPDGVYHSYHGVHKNGNAGTLLYVHGNAAGSGENSPGSPVIPELTEPFIQRRSTLENILLLLTSQNVVYAPDATMQAMLSDSAGRTLIIEPGIGYRLEKRRYSLLSNYSSLEPENTRPFLVPGDGRYERAEQILSGAGENFSVPDGFSLLKSVRQEGAWATRVSFVYSRKQQTVYCVENNDFQQIREYPFSVNEGG